MRGAFGRLGSALTVFCRGWLELIEQVSSGDLVEDGSVPVEDITASLEVRENQATQAPPLVFTRAAKPDIKTRC